LALSNFFLLFFCSTYRFCSNSTVLSRARNWASLSELWTLKAEHWILRKIAACRYSIDVQWYKNKQKNNEVAIITGLSVWRQVFNWFVHSALLCQSFRRSCDSWRRRRSRLYQPSPSLYLSKTLFYLAGFIWHKSWRFFLVFLKNNCWAKWILILLPTFTSCYVVHFVVHILLNMFIVVTFYFIHTLFTIYCCGVYHLSDTLRN